MVVSSTNNRRPAPFPAFPAFCVFYLYIIRYNRNGHGCRPRINGGGRFIQKDGGGCAPHRHGHGFRARPTGARRAASGVPIRAKCTQNGGQNGQKCDEMGLFGASEGSAGAYLQGVQGARAGTRRVAWRLLSRANRAFFAATPA